MLTHTWILRELIADIPLNHQDRDIYTYNVAPDILSIHRQVTSKITHGIDRFSILPEKHRKAVFVLFHLLVDDISHHGKIGAKPISDFDPDAQGYSYVKGRSLVPKLTAFYKHIGKEISYEEAVYRSHMIIEMAFDLVLCQSREANGLALLFCESLDYTVDQDREVFSETIAWLFGIEKGAVAEAISQGRDTYSLERIQNFMNLEGRVGLFVDKFGLERGDSETWQGMKNLMSEGMELTRDYTAFLPVVLNAVKEAGFDSGSLNIRRPS